MSGTVPQRRYLDDKDSCLLQSTIDFQPQREEDIYGRNKKRGFSNNLRKLQKTLFTMLRQSCIEEIFFCVCKFVITGLFLPIFI